MHNWEKCVNYPYMTAARTSWNQLWASIDLEPPVLSHRTAFIGRRGSHRTFWTGGSTCRVPMNLGCGRSGHKSTSVVLCLTCWWERGGKSQGNNPHYYSGSVPPEWVLSKWNLVPKGKDFSFTLPHSSQPSVTTGPVIRRDLHCFCLSTVGILDRKQKPWSLPYGARQLGTG